MHNCRDSYHYRAANRAIAKCRFIPGEQDRVPEEDPFRETHPVVPVLDKAAERLAVGPPDTQRVCCLRRSCACASQRHNFASDRFPRAEASGSETRETLVVRNGGAFSG